jgi:capsular polysaccharide biosynthesis protein
VLRSALIALLSALIAAAAAFGAATKMEPEYAAQSDILFDLGNRQDVLEKFLATQSVVAKSQAVLAPVSRNFGISLKTLDEVLSVDFPRGGAVMRLRYADKKPETALAILQSIIDGYVGLLSRTHSLNSRTEILVPVFLLDEPVWPKPIQAAAMS